MVCPCLVKSFQQKEKLDDCTYFGRLFRRWSKFRNQTRPLTQLNTPSVVARFYWISTTQTSAMSYSISTLLTRNLHDVFVKTTPRVGARLRATMRTCSRSHACAASFVRRGCQLMKQGNGLSSRGGSIVRKLVIRFVIF